jgi:polyhydroxyalkanoate synthesis regulator phasin
MSLTELQRLQKLADKAVAKGRISHPEYRDLSWRILQAMKPADCARVIGLSAKPVRDKSNVVN